MHRWKFRDSLECDCGNESQTLEHIVSDCPKRNFQGEMKDIMALTKESFDWIVIRHKCIDND